MNAIPLRRLTDAISGANDGLFDRLRITNLALKFIDAQGYTVSEICITQRNPKIWIVEGDRATREMDGVICKTETVGLRRVQSYFAPRYGCEIHWSQTEVMA
jgi:hypothetical protein